MKGKRKQGPLSEHERAVGKVSRRQVPKQQGWHCGTIHHRIIETLKGAQYGTLKIPLSAKVTNDTSERVPEASYLSRDTPDLSRTPFLIGLPGPDPLMSKQHLKMGLQAPRDHRGHGTSFR
ncbi:hypothetical protein CDL15_Pgr013182 [Punica granatum]|uniref:Uncharacterized protein n=1 Tax=Punica granatum TaxID=22663 RepID=A0A218W961_PUNGR|nr:hypothetical protein CDL15_Pgr013182 [Punica granatum]